MEQDKMAAWLGIYFPTNTTKVEGFLGCVSYYRRFIQHFVKLAFSLTCMLRMSVDFEPTPARMQSFNDLKRRLVKAPVLMMPDWSKDFHIFVDVSGFCIGVVLSQLDDRGRDHPIYFASRLLAAD